MRYDNGVLQNARVKIDGSGDREFKQALATYLRKRLRFGQVVKVKFANSKSDNLIQLADMSVGAIARSYKPESGSRQWRQMLRTKIEDVFEFR
jgi:hypothetical protein